MATATKEKPTTDDLLLFLGEEDAPLAAVLERCGRDVLSRAWAKGEVEFGRTKYVVTGAPDGKRVGKTLVIEDGIDWSGAKTARHGRLARVLEEKLPEAEFHQRYRKEVCVQPSRDQWDVVASDADIKGREVRWARLDSTREECEALWQLRVRLTDKGVAALQAD